jgi:hypothetical protein
MLEIAYFTESMTIRKQFLGNYLLATEGIFSTAFDDGAEKFMNKHQAILCWCSNLHYAGKIPVHLSPHPTPHS